MKNRFIVLSISLLFFSNSFGQNLVPNGSFEEYTTDNIPYRPKQLKNIKGGWEYFTNINTFEKPDILVCKEGGKKDENWIDGRVCLIIRNYQTANRNALRKAIFQVPLTEKLEKDICYRLSCDLRIVVPKQTDSIVNPKLVQFFFADYKLDSLNKIDELIKQKPVNMLPGGLTYYEYSHDYRHLSSDFVANGKEKYLVFGIVDTIYTKLWTIFFLDNVKLIKINSNSAIINSFEIGNTIVMENILFETNKAVLKPSSFTSLNQLCNELKKQNNLKIEVSGHTDNVGLEPHNLELSEQRAKAVVNYLEDNGISTNRLSFKGYGSSKPVAGNDTPEGRAKNRRVEITVVDNR